MTATPATINVPVPANGPTASLSLNDPATWLMILSAVAAILTKAVPAVAGLRIEPFFPAAALIAAAIVTATVLASKHRYAAALATVIPPVEALAARLDPAVTAQVAPLLDAVVAAAVPAVVATATPIVVQVPPVVTPGG